MSDLTTLTPLHGHLSAIYAYSFFHLFDEAQQLLLARALAGLLSPAPGSLILGSHRGMPQEGMRTVEPSPSWRGMRQFCHSAESWAKMWETEVFEKGTVKVNATLEEVQRADLTHLPAGTRHYFLVWSVIRI